jgi:phosphatidylglycerol---prolipoprotein diacylglyceryl transferase
MIPYADLNTLRLPLGIELHAFGLFVALGIAAGSQLATRAARVYGPGRSGPLADLASWAVVGGIIGGHLLHVLGYHPELLHQEGAWVVLKLWDGLSSMGGVLGALLAIWAFGRVKRVPITPYLDALALGTAPGWAIARIGCFLAHDHPGNLTAFPLAVAYPGGARHDLGLYDFVVLLALTAVLYALARRKRAPGFLMGVLAVGYAIARFSLDFLRAQDLPFVDGRIFGLTPAQYVVMPMLCAGVFLAARALRHPLAQPGGDALARGN